MKTTPRPEVTLGQIWRDRDRRSMSGRRFVLVRNISTNVAVPYVYYVEALSNGVVLSERVYRSRKDRFQRAFELAKTADAVGQRSENPI